MRGGAERRAEIQKKGEWGGGGGGGGGCCNLRL